MCLITQLLLASIRATLIEEHEDDSIVTIREIFDHVLGTVQHDQWTIIEQY